MNFNVEIFSQGEELLIGQTTDTNAAWLSEQLVGLGFQVTRHTTVGDNLAHLKQVLKEIAERADCCLCTGGLGPTSDDLTAQAVAAAFDLPLEFDPIAYAQISAFFERRHRSMPESNRKQAMLPKGARRIDNAWGTAPGFAVRYQRCWFAFMPGVPFEMRHLFNETIKPVLIQNYPTQPYQRVTFKTIGIGESAIQEKIAAIALPDSVQLGFRTSDEENQTKLLFPYAFPPLAKTSLIEQFSAALGDYVFAIDDVESTSGDLVGVIDQLLAARTQTISVLETASQGLIAAKCVDHSWFVRSVYQQDWRQFCIAYHLEATTENLSALAIELAKRERQSSGADYALVQLYVDESSKFQNKDQSITLYNALVSEQSVHAQTINVAGPPRRKQNQAALMALDLLRRFLQHKTL